MEYLNDEECRFALGRAREIVNAVVRREPIPKTTYPEVFQASRGVFVTLTKSGDLCGCIGFPYPTMPLQTALEEAAVAATSQDPRFLPITLEELPEISVEVTVLTEPRELEGPAEERADHVVIGKHGLIVQVGCRRGLLLPQVAVEYDLNPKQFLAECCRKACLPSSTWTEDDCQVFLFEGQIISE